MSDRPDPNGKLTPLPVGVERFHRRTFINYQLNRAHALGFADRAELYEAAGQIRSSDDAVAAFENLSMRADADGRARQATSYLRLAEFFTPPRTPAKVLRYRRYRRLFDGAFAGSGVARHEVPYRGATLPAYVLPADRQISRGTVLLDGGSTP